MYPMRIRFIIPVLGLLLLPAAIHAETLKSNNYSVEESYVGPGGLIDSSSSNYRVSDSIGDTAVGTSESGTYRTDAGAPTPAVPFLAFTVNTTAVNLGLLSSSATKTGTATFSVRNYVSKGYVVQIVGPAPTNAGRPLSALGANTASATGSEQFGINLAANSVATAQPSSSFGAGPVQIPDSSFSFGTAANNYNTGNSFRYVSGETIAQSPKSSGQTDFTLSMIANITSTTPSGAYTSTLQLICTPTY